MNGPLFRPVSFWQSALMTLPDQAFFELMRSVLGTIKTPFNKQRLLEDLSVFLSRPDILETMAALITVEDRRIISAVALLNEPAPGEMESFFSGEYSYAELQSLLLNLEERLITYRFREEGIFHLALNPKLESILAPIAGNRGILFPSLPPGSAVFEASPVMNGRILAALFSFFLRNETVYKNENQRDSTPQLKKKILDEGNRIFPGLDIENLAEGLIVLGLLNRDDEFLKADEQRIAVFKKLNDRGVFEYLAAGIALHLERKALATGEAHVVSRGAAISGSSYISRGLLRNLVRLIHGLIDALGSLSGFPETTLIKLIEVLRREETGSWGFAGELPSQAAIFKALLLSGLLVQAGNVCRFTLGVDGGAGSSAGKAGDAESGGAEKAEPAIAMDSPFSCILYPEISFADALDLAAFAEAEETGTTVRFTLSRESVIRGFDRGLDAAFLWKLLERLSSGRAGDALKWNLEDWEKRYREVSLYQGVVLSLSGERSYLAGTGPLASMIQCTLAPGIYLLSSGADEAAAALRAAGVDILARPRGAVYEKTGAPPFLLPEENPPAGLEADAAVTEGGHPGDGGLPKEGGHPQDGLRESVESIQQKFRAMLDGMSLGRQEREELEARIKRRVIVSATQLSGAALRYEKLEARSLDYVGKSSIAKQAIAAGSVLEVNWSGPGGPSKVLGIPETLEKRGGEMTLVLRPRAQDEALRIPLGKISFLRRIKQSIFGE
jgi:hypothetical protein